MVVNEDRRYEVVKKSRMSFREIYLHQYASTMKIKIEIELEECGLKELKIKKVAACIRAKLFPSTPVVRGGLSARAWLLFDGKSGRGASKR